MGYWLMKTDPDTYGIDDLEREPKQITPWEGVRNYQARNMLRDDMKLGDTAFFYHSRCKEPSIVGIVEVVKTGYPDSEAFNPQSRYYDPKSSPENPLWYRVDVKLKKHIRPPITLSSLRLNPVLKDMLLLQRGSRLSITPVTKLEFKAILEMN